MAEDVEVDEQADQPKNLRERQQRIDDNQPARRTDDGLVWQVDRNEILRVAKIIAAYNALSVQYNKTENRYQVTLTAWLFATRELERVKEELRALRESMMDRNAQEDE